jgi:hypothetical protein
MTQPGAVERGSPFISRTPHFISRLRLPGTDVMPTIFRKWMGKRHPSRKEPPNALDKTETNLRRNSENASKGNVTIRVSETPHFDEVASRLPVSPTAPLPSPKDTIAGPPPQSPFQRHPARTPLEVARAELKLVTESFQAQVRKFQIKMGNVPDFDMEVREAVNAASSIDGGIRQAAATFQDQIIQIMSMNAQKSGMEERKWYNKVASLVGALYPAVRLTLGFTADLAGVMNLCSRSCV